VRSRLTYGPRSRAARARAEALPGFVALAQVAGHTEGSRWIVPAELHTPIRQDAVLLARGAGDEAARAFVAFLREADAGVAVKDLCRKHGFSEGSYYLWRSKFGGMSVSDAKRLKELEIENTRLKKLLADSLLENEVTREALRRKW